MDVLFEMSSGAAKRAHGLIEGVVDSKILKEDGWNDIAVMREKTRGLIEKNVPAIAEATFSEKGFYCTVDILKNNFDGTWDIMEVKTSTRRIPVYFHDIAFQKYVAQLCGLRINKCHLVAINNKYVKSGEIDAKKLFNIEDITETIDPFFEEVEKNLTTAKEVVDSKEEPNIDLNESCSSPYPCSFYSHCSKHLPENNIFNVYKMGGVEKFLNYRNGIVSFEDIRKNEIELTDMQRRQVDTVLDNLNPHVDRDGIAGFLSQLKFPIYFLDFETYSSTIPKYDGEKPFQQITFQYSLHILKKEGGKLKHKEFLAKENKREWKKLAERLSKDIKSDGGSIVAYSKNSEIRSIKDMAKAFPHLREKLYEMADRVVDLLDVFQNGYYYNKEMEGKFSIKSVLPALFPNHPELDYRKNEDIKGGMAASLAYATLEKRDKKERKRIRKNLLKYCHLDTLAMVEIYKELLKIAK